MQWFEQIRAKREHLGLSQAELAKSVGVSQALINKIEQGRVGWSRSIVKISSALEIDINSIQRQIMDGPRPRLSPGEKVISSAMIAFYPSKPVNIGSFHILTTFVDFIPRLPHLFDVSGASAVLVSENSMAPELEIGDVVYIDPLLPKIEGTLVCVNMKLKETLILAMFGRLVMQNDRFVIISQWRGGRDPVEIKLDRTEWPDTQRISSRSLRR